jgi:manganese/zinc/iron transport system permease protein
MFGLGLCLLRLATEMPSGNAAGLNGFIFGKAASMIAKDTMVISVVAMCTACTVAGLRKEFTALCFDENFGAVQGWPILRLDVILMTLVAVVTVIALQSVGLVLAVAMLIIPAAAARYWCSRIGTLLAVSAVIGCLGGWLGGVVSALVPRMPTGPVIVLVCGGWFVFSFIFGPVNGVVVRQWRVWRLQRRVAWQHILRAMYEASVPKDQCSISSILACRSWSLGRVKKLLKRLKRKGLAVELTSDTWSLSVSGMKEATRIVRNHRLWETYLIHHADIAPNHVDRDADMIEHVLGSEMVAKLESLLGSDPIPHSPHPIEVST